MFDWITPELAAIFWAVFKALVLLIGLVVAGAQMIWLERRMLGLWQDRYGPNRVGWFGLLQVPADMVKIFFKEDWTPPFVDKFAFILAPALAIGLMLLAFCLVPVTPEWVVTSPQDGILFFFAIAGLAVYAVMLGGWSSNSKYALLGGLRSTAQMISYEVFMGLSLMGIVMITGSFDLNKIVEAQRDIPWTKPEDIPFDPNGPLPELGGFTPEGFNAAFADGAVRYIKKSVSPQILKALITRAGGEVISSDSY